MISVVAKEQKTFKGVSMSLAIKYVAWTYQTQANGTFYTCLTWIEEQVLRFSQHPFDSDLHKQFTSSTPMKPLCHLAGRVFAGGVVRIRYRWGPNALSGLCFIPTFLMVVTNGSFCNMTRLFDRVGGFDEPR